MDNDDRLRIKNLILAESENDNSEIPLLSYIHLEIIDPEGYVDEELIELLDNSNLEGVVTNKLFFQCIEESPDYLAYESFRKKLGVPTLLKNYGTR